MAPSTSHPGTEAMLLDLLETPKTRGGLVAAVAAAGLSQRFIYGWLSAKVSQGEVRRLLICGRNCYQVADNALPAHPSVYPRWLDPREIPTSTARRVYRTPKLKVKPQHAKLPTSPD